MTASVELYVANGFMDPISNEYDMVIKEIEDYMPECNVVRADVCSSQSSPSEGTCDGSIQYVSS